MTINLEVYKFLRSKEDILGKQGQNSIIVQYQRQDYKVYFRLSTSEYDIRIYPMLSSSEISPFSEEFEKITKIALDKLQLLSSNTKRLEILNNIVLSYLEKRK